MSMMLLEVSLNQVEDLLRESIQLTEIDINEIEKLIDDLKAVKNKFRKGPDRKYYRKESARIQGAIQALRFIRNKKQRLLEKES